MALASTDWNRPILARVSVWRLMSGWRPVLASTSPAGRPVIRPLRLTTGLILFAFASSHLITHAFGVHSVQTFQDVGFYLLKPWQTLPGHLILYTAFTVHAGLGLYAVYRRRHFLIPPTEFWQLALGLAIPVLFIPDAVAIGLGKSFCGMKLGPPRKLYEFWVVSPDLALPRQYLLII